MDQSNATYWTGSGWSVSEDWFLAVGGDTWTYDLSAGSLTDGTAYEVRSRATDAVGNLQTNYGLDTLTYDRSEERRVGMQSPIYRVRPGTAPRGSLLSMC